MDAPRHGVGPVRRRRPVHGVLLLDKPVGLSSNQALQKAKWLLRAEKAGHTGTLDPLASGVLPLCFGAATKFSALALEADKTYEALLRLGQTTRSGDAEGEVLQERPITHTAADVSAVLARFAGRIRQRPPMHSALKHDGRPLYELARQGIEVERAEREVTLHAIEPLPLPEGVDAACHLRLRVRCSKGTYIRTLAEDIGEALGCGAHLAGLRRTETAGFDLSQCIGLPELEALPEDARASALRPADSLLAGHARVSLDAAEAARFLTGLRRRGPWADAPAVAVYAEAPGGVHDLLGVAHITAGELIPDRLLSPLEVAQSRCPVPVPNSPSLST